MRIVPFLLCTVIIGFVLGGCATVYRDPQAKGVPKETIAVLLDPSSISSDVIITHINGRRRGTGFFRRFELPPGMNTVTLVGNSQAGMRTDRTVLSFFAEEGKTYIIRFETGEAASIFKPKTWDDGPGRFSVFIEEEGTGKIVAEVRRSLTSE